MSERMETIIDAYQEGRLDRRGSMARLIALTGSMAAAHLLLESSGLAATLVSERESRQIKVSSETVKYESAKDVPGAGHAFFNDTGERYNADAAKDAWTRTLAFLRTELK